MSLKATFSTVMGLVLVKHRAIKGATSSSTNTATVISGSVTSTSVAFTDTTATVTYTATAPHRLATGQKVTVAGASNALFNGVFEITVTGPTTFTYTASAAYGGALAESTGITATYTPHAQWALIVGASTNTDNITIGPDVNADLDIVSPGQSYGIPLPPGLKFDLGEWYVKSATASQSYKVLFI